MSIVALVSLNSSGGNNPTMRAEVRKAKVTPETLRESEKLRALWDRTPAKPSQAIFGERYAIGSQSAVASFLGGKTPLSMKAAQGFAAGLNCKLSDFSGRLDAEARLGLLAIDDAHRAGHTPGTPAAFVAETKEHWKMPIGQLLAQVDAVIQSAAPVLRRATREALMKWVIGEATAEETTAALEAFAAASKNMTEETPAPPGDREPQAQPDRRAPLPEIKYPGTMYSWENNAPPRAPAYKGLEKRKAG